MKLGERQRLFMRLLPRLIDFAHEQGYEMTQGDAYRDPRVHGALGVKMGYGHPNSNHKNRLAKDINLFKGGVFLEKTEDHKPLGEFWEKLHPLCRWGGRFNDGNHYSIESPEGMK
jgi:hypothetical protein